MLSSKAENQLEVGILAGAGVVFSSVLSSGVMFCFVALTISVVTSVQRFDS